jgi:hypothetical protein
LPWKISSSWELLNVSRVTIYTLLPHKDWVCSMAKKAATLDNPLLAEPCKTWNGPSYWSFWMSGKLEQYHTCSNPHTVPYEMCWHMHWVRAWEKTILSERMRQTLIIFFTDGGQPFCLSPGGFRGPGGLPERQDFGY